MRIDLEMLMAYKLGPPRRFGPFHVWGNQKGTGIA